MIQNLIHAEVLFIFFNSARHLNLIEVDFVKTQPNGERASNGK